MAVNNQNDDFFFDPEHDEAEDASGSQAYAPPSFAPTPPEYLTKQKDYLERLLAAWQSAHGSKKKNAA